MGCDGGSIPHRSELVKTKTKTPPIDNAIKLNSLFFLCYLSKEPLANPIVSCGLGRLYNKEAILEYLVSGSHSLKHIKSLKDVTVLNTTPNPALLDNHTVFINNATSVQTKAPFVCPITQKEMNGHYGFSYPPCGCLISDQALKEIRDYSCLLCGKEFDLKDLIPINPIDSDKIKMLEDSIVEKYALQNELKALRKAEKLKRKGCSNEEEKIKITKKGKKNLTTIPSKEAQETQETMSQKSTVLQSLFVKKDKYGKVIEEDTGFLVKGTFNRFAASF